MIEFDREESQPTSLATIKVVGIGGAGGNTINCMVDSGYKGVDFVAINTDAQALRNDRGKTQRKKILNAGWHFSYLGGVEKIVEKLESFAHAEFDNDTIKNRSRIANRIDAGKDNLS